MNFIYHMITEVMHLHNNAFDGNIPDGFQMLSSLSKLSSISLLRKKLFNPYTFVYTFLL